MAKVYGTGIACRPLGVRAAGVNAAGLRIARSLMLYALTTAARLSDSQRLWGMSLDSRSRLKGEVMRMLLGLLSLLVVVFVVAQLARTQLQAVRAPVPAKAASAAAAGPNPQQQVVDELNKALELGRQRAASAVD